MDRREKAGGAGIFLISSEPSFSAAEFARRQLKEASGALGGAAVRQKQPAITRTSVSAVNCPRCPSRPVTPYLSRLPRACLPGGNVRYVSSGEGSPNSRLRADRAAYHPHRPWTEGPGGVEDEHR